MGITAWESPKEEELEESKKRLHILKEDCSSLKDQLSENKNTNNQHLLTKRPNSVLCTSHVDLFNYSSVSVNDSHFFVVVLSTKMMSNSQ